jgi:membrane protease YdiL (CAAX protease family)
MWQWIVVAFLWWGTRKRGVQLKELAGPRWASFAACLEDFGVAIGFLFVSYIVLGIASHILNPETNAAIISILPKSRAEVVSYIAMSISAGITEELIFRGYLMRQVGAMFGGLPVAIVLQGAIFGAAHGYQGWKRMIILSIFGILFGLLANWRRSLRPGMIGHGLSDALVGVLWFARH